MAHEYRITAKDHLSLADVAKRITEILYGSEHLGGECSPGPSPRTYDMPYGGHLVRSGNDRERTTGGEIRFKAGMSVSAGDLAYLSEKIGKIEPWFSQEKRLQAAAAHKV